MTKLWNLSVTARGCRYDLNNLGGIVSAAKAATYAAGLEVVRDDSQAFIPHGVTVVLILAESHLVISTWPEYGTAVIDLSVCTSLAAAEALGSGIELVLMAKTVEKFVREVVLLPEMP